jgi:hypothetical protein
VLAIPIDTANNPLVYSDILPRPVSLLQSSLFQQPNKKETNVYSSLQPMQKSSKTKFSTDQSEKQKEKQKDKQRQQRRDEKRNWLD